MLEASTGTALIMAAVSLRLRLNRQRSSAAISAIDKAGQSNAARQTNMSPCLAMLAVEAAADLEPGQNVEVFLHVCAQHLLNHCSPQCRVVCAR